MKKHRVLLQAFQAENGDASQRSVEKGVRFIRAETECVSQWEKTMDHWVSKGPVGGFFGMRH